LPRYKLPRSLTIHSKLCNRCDETFQWRVKSTRYLSWICLIFPVFCVAFWYRKVETVTTCSGSNELWSLFALVVIKTWILELTYVSLYYIVLFFLRRGSVVKAKMEIIRMNRRAKEEIEIHEELILFNNGNDDEIRILISKLSIKMVALYLKLTF